MASEVRRGLPLKCPNEGRRPVLLVTCRTGTRAWCEEELGDVLFEVSPDIVVVETGFPDVLVVCSSAEPRTLYNRAKGGEYGFVENIVPVDRVLSGLEELEAAIKSAVRPCERVRLRVKSFGVRGVSSEVWQRAVEYIERAGGSVDKSSPTCLHIMVFKESILLGRGLCKAVFKVT
ncbi:MAG: RNA-binding protein [Thermogladius sp.]